MDKYGQKNFTVGKLSLIFPPRFPRFEYYLNTVQLLNQCNWSFIVYSKFFYNVTCITKRFSELTTNNSDIVSLSLKSNGK